MRTHRIFTPQALAPESEIVLEEKTAHYLSRVLRVARGQTLELFNGDGHDYAAEVLQPGKGDFRVSVLSRLPSLPEPGLKIAVVQAISRGERMDITLRKCTELGAAAFQPILTERVEVRIHPDKLARRMAHWQQIIISACEQCGRSTLPELSEPKTLFDTLDTETASERLALVPGAEKPLSRVNVGDAVELLIGPEGGFSDRELTEMSLKNVRPVSLGPRILRTETAGPAAVTVLQTLHGDFS